MIFPALIRKLWQIPGGNELVSVLAQDLGLSNSDLARTVRQHRDVLYVRPAIHPEWGHVIGIRRSSTGALCLS